MVRRPLGDTKIKMLGGAIVSNQFDVDHPFTLRLILRTDDFGAVTKAKGQLLYTDADLNCLAEMKFIAKPVP